MSAAATRCGIEWSFGLSETMILAENLGKQYRRGTSGGPTTLRDTLGRWLALGGSTAHPHLGGTEAFWALRNVSFEVKRGEVLGIIGANGSGKSTLLKILSRITRPTEGTAHLRGRIASLLEVGTGFHPQLTGRENIFLNGAIIGMSRAEVAGKFDEIVEFSGVEKFIETPVKHYSSGMYTRLAFSVSAHLDSEIMLVDEVLAVGDLAFQRRCMERMAKAREEGRTILFVSHGLASVNKLCSRAILLENGICTHIGTSQDVTGQYAAEASIAAEATRTPEPVVELPAPEDPVPAYGLGLAIADSGGTPRVSFEVGEPWEASFDFEVAERVPNLIAGVGLATPDGIPIATIWSAPTDTPPGRYRFTANFDLPLASGTFSLQVGLSAGDASLYLRNDVASFSVIPSTRFVQVHLDKGAGILYSTKVPEIVALGTAAVHAG